MQRVGWLGDDVDIADRYLSVGTELYETTRAAAARLLDLTDAVVLDLGCGAGRVTRHWINEDGTLADVTRVVGTDVDPASIAWLNAHLAPPLTGIVCGHRPPLPFDDGTFDLVIALSVFTHLDVWWAEWIAEMHRLLRPGGVAVISVLETSQMTHIFGCQPDGSEGMTSLASGRPWDVGGPVVFHDRWWLHEHWGRGFEVQIEDENPLITEGNSVLQTKVTLRRDDGPPLDAFHFERIDATAEERERTAARRARAVREQVHGQPSAFGPTHRLAPWIRRRIEDADPGLATVGLEISALDDMYRNTLEYAASPADTIQSYFSVALEVTELLDRIVRWHFGDWERIGSFLDFASGYGRITRMLVQRLPAGRIAVGEIQAEALQFQSINFGVEPIVATVDDIHLAEDRRFDVVLVVSLFTHLPRETWVAWLRRLWERTADGGLLVFTTHNSDQMPLGSALDDGFWFAPQSEIPRLDTSRYGTNFTSDEFVQAAIREVCGEFAATTQRLTRAISGLHDVYVVARGDVESTISTDRRWPDGALDHAVRLQSGDVRIDGWAGGDIEPADLVGVAVSVGSLEIDVERGLPRPDVAAARGRAWDLDLNFSGWSAVIPADAATGDDLLTIVLDHGGERLELLTGPARETLRELER